MEPFTALLEKTKALVHESRSEDLKRMQKYYQVADLYQKASTTHSDLAILVSAMQKKTVALERIENVIRQLCTKPYDPTGQIAAVLKRCYIKRDLLSDELDSMTYEELRLTIHLENLNALLVE
jgi:hypothetical protein